MLVHRWLHLFAVKDALTNEARVSMLCDCWELVSTVPTCSVWPEWAEEVRAAGEPPSAWCPVVNPALVERVSD